jgi:hypothetical protein
MEAKTNQPEKRSRYIAAGSPQECFLPSCRKSFQDSCVRGKNEGFYCSQACAEIGGSLDRALAEEPSMKSVMPTPRQKLLAGRR